MSNNGNGNEPIAGTGIFVPLSGIGDYQQGRTYPLEFDRDYNPPVDLGGEPETLWRLTLHRRQFNASLNWEQTLIGEIHYARGRRLEWALNTATTLTFTLDGEHPMAPNVVELQTDVRAWRYDEKLGHDVCMFRGIVYQAEDELTEQSNVIVFTAKDYLGMLERRIFPITHNFPNNTQDDMVYFMLELASLQTTASGHSFQPGSYLPIQRACVNRDGSVRNPGAGGGRIRSYVSGSIIFDMFDELAHVEGGFDYDILPSGAPGHSPVNPNLDDVRIFYPSQGAYPVRTDMMLVYGVNVAGVTRTVTSANYTNHWRTIGQAPPNAPQDTEPNFAEVYNDDSNNTAQNPFGLWTTVDNAADVWQIPTLTAQAQGNLNLAGILTPTYALTLRPGAYSYGYPNMGDIVPLIIQGGRLNVNTQERVVGINIDIGDDGNEDVELIVGRPGETLPGILKKTAKDVAALTRR